MLIQYFALTWLWLAYQVKWESVIVSKMDIRKQFRSQASTSEHESVTQSKNEDGGSDTEITQPDTNLIDLMSVLFLRSTPSVLPPAWATLFQH